VIVPDVNVLLYAFRDDLPAHEDHRKWLLDRLAGEEPVALPDAVLAGFMRVVTHPRIFSPPTPPLEAAAFVDALLAAPGAVTPTLSAAHLETFLCLCTRANARGSLVADAYLAAVAIELDAVLVTTDRDFARFQGLRWRHLLS
jgi:toxin-antitoxin system PIN domain toxin